MNFSPKFMNFSQKFRAQKTKEAGIFEHMFNGIFLVMAMGDEAGFVALQTRASTQFETGQAPLPYIALQNTKQMVAVVTILLFISVLTLITEVLVAELVATHGQSVCDKIRNRYSRWFRIKRRSNKVRQVNIVARKPIERLETIPEIE